MFQGHKAMITSIAGILGGVAKIITDLANGKTPDELSVTVVIGGLWALFQSLKGKRIEAKLDLLHEKVGK